MALGAIEKAIGENMDPRMLTKLLIHRLRVVLLMRFAPELAEEFGKELTEADLALAKEISKEPGVTSETLRALLDAYAHGLRRCAASAARASRHRHHMCKSRQSA